MVECLPSEREFPGSSLGQQHIVLTFYFKYTIIPMSVLGIFSLICLLYNFQ
jgi:hypothetical protein